MLTASYSLLDRILHRLVLGSRTVRSLTLDAEKMYVKTRALDTTQDIHGKAQDVCVAGLARSGTTLLLRILGDSGVFVSLTYRDMPFVLAPGAWRSISRFSRRHMDAVQRPHRDGIMVDYDSPEAFEDVFWNTVGRYSTKDHCLEFRCSTDVDAMQEFAIYRKLIVASRAAPGLQNRRYLSKNNNNLLRLAQICADRTMCVIVPYRHPLECASSLFRQHLNFSDLQASQTFAREYMKLLVHHEFGLDHLPLSVAVPYMQHCYAADDPNYWLDYWCAIHEWLLNSPSFQLVLFAHDILVRQPRELLTELARVIELPSGNCLRPELVNENPRRVHGTLEFAANLIAKALQIYQRLSLDGRNLVPPGA